MIGHVAHMSALTPRLAVEGVPKTRAGTVKARTVPVGTA